MLPKILTPKIGNNSIDIPIRLWGTIMLFLILTVILFNIIVIFMPKRMSGIEMVATSFFSMYLQLVFDVYLDLKYDLYGYFEKGADWESVIYLLGIYPAVNLLFLNFFPYKKAFKGKFYYISGWVLFSIVYEKLFLWSGTFYYNGWKMWYSFIIYPGLLLILVLFHNYILYLLKKVQK
jgi:hypothetical protein